MGDGVQPAVTVLMPVYNGERYLADTMHSILSQSYRDFEFLIVDDGSTDQSLAIVESFNDPRIRIVQNPERMKLSGALNRGIQESTGAYIARMDGDDIALPDRLGKQVEFLDTHAEIGLCGTWFKRFGAGAETVDKPFGKSDQVKAYTLFDCPFAHPTVMFRKEWFARHKLQYDGSYYPTEDYELWGRALDCFPGANLPEVLLHYRVHADSMTCSDWQDMDGKAALIAGQQLKKLGLEVSGDELRFHRNLGRGQSYAAGDMSEVHRAETWLLKLEQANMERHWLHESAFREVMALVWFRLCMHAVPLGLPVLRSYSSSRLRRQDAAKNQRTALLALSIAKNRMLRGPAR